jgi:hypothetical protein
VQKLKSAVAKNGSFAFAEGLACAFGAKANVPFVRLDKIGFKKVRWKKNKKHWVGLSVVTNCRVEIRSVCCLLVKIVCLCD